MMPALFVRRFGAGAPTLLLLHGLGVNGDVWDRFRERLGGWPGRIVVPDLRGHGRSPHATSYSDEDHAADVAGLLSDEDEIYIVGHSMGGMISLVLSSGDFDISVKKLFAFGVKAAWTDEERAKIKAYSEAPAKVFATKAEAVERFLKASGLKDLVDAGAPVVEAGITNDKMGYRLAADPRTTMVAGTSLQKAFDTSKADKQLACGEKDALVTVAQLRAIDPTAIDLGPYGHNIHVENPDRLIDSVPFLATKGQ
jgi:pimeloyl-ACP methyl ester carboxylesterase